MDVGPEISGDECARTKNAGEKRDLLVLVHISTVFEALDRIEGSINVLCTGLRGRGATRMCSRGRRMAVKGA